MNSRVLTKFKECLKEILLDFFSNKITEENVLKELNGAVYYNNYFKAYIYELFYIVSLEEDKIPTNISFLVSLFKTTDTLVEDSYDVEGTRSKVLKKLKLKKTLELYKFYLICNHEESHTFFKAGVNDTIYQKAHEVNPSREDIVNSIIYELASKKI